MHVYLQLSLYPLLHCHHYTPEERHLYHPSIDTLLWWLKCRERNAKLVTPVSPESLQGKCIPLLGLC